MERYISSVKDLVLETRSKFSLIKTSADRGDAESCFKMGMLHLLGIKNPIDFKKAVRFFNDQSLVDNKEAKRLLGFISECEGDYSKAFQYYAKSSNSEKDSYLDAAIKERTQLQAYLKKLDLPDTSNKVLSEILSDYSKGKASKVGACIKIAAICNDEQTCYEVAKIMYDSNDYISATEWLQRGKIGPDKKLYVSINEKIEKTIKTVVSSKDIQIIDLDSDSLLAVEDTTPFLEKVKKACDKEATKGSAEWKEKNKKRIDTIIKIQEEKEEKERLEEEAAEEARQKKRKAIIWASIIGLLGFFLGLMADGTFISGVKGTVGMLFWYFVIRWYINRNKDKKKKKNGRRRK